MDYVVIEGVRPWDGRYEFDISSSPLTTREWGWIKRLSGYMPLTLDEGFQGGDPELFTVLAMVALYRAGKIDQREVPETYERFVDEALETKIRFEFGTPASEADEGPLPPSSNGSDVSSGPASRRSSETSPAPPSPSGTPASGSMEFDRPTSAR